MNSSGIYLNDEDINVVNESCKLVTSPTARKKVMDALCAVSIAGKYLESYNVSVDTTSLCCIEDFVQTHGITDIYVNGHYVNVITAERDSELLVPCLHFDKNTAPMAYLFIEIDNEQHSYEPLGFILKDDIDTNSMQGGYYAVNKALIKSFREIEYLFAGHVEEEVTDAFEKQIFNYLDGNLTNSENFLYTLLNSKEARSFLIKAYKAKIVFNYVSTPENNVSNDIASNNTIPDMSDNTIDDNEQLFDMNEQNIDNFDIGELAQTEDFNVGNTDYVVQDNTDTESVMAEQILDYDNDADIVQNDTQEEIYSEYNTGTTPSLEDIEKDLSNSDAAVYESASNNNSIDNLYNNQPDNPVYGAQFIPPKKKSSFIPTLLILALIAGGGYYGYTKFFQNTGVPYNDTAEIDSPADIQAEETKDITSDAMPIETVENTQNVDSTEEALSVSIPAIEKNLDASILVENLSVNWQVPSGYVSNSAAKRYFTRIGKIIQLNLKTEMLLLNKPPLSDKIVLELEYNKTSQNFEIKELTTSSGEKTIDDLVKHVVAKTLKTGKYTDMSIFKNIPGNPSLVVHL